MSGIETGDRVRVNGTESPYEGMTGEVRGFLDTFYGVGVVLDGLDGPRYFSEGELVPIRTVEGEQGT